MVEIRFPYDVNRHYLSTHFRATELQCGGINDDCGCKKVVVVPRLLRSLETTREKLGLGVYGGIIINEGVRCLAYQRKLYKKINERRALKGLPPLKAPKVGYHVTGESVDTPSIVVPGEEDSQEEAEYLEMLRSCGWVGIGISKPVFDEETGSLVKRGWTHLDVRLGDAVIWRYGYGR